MLLLASSLIREERVAVRLLVFPAHETSAPSQHALVEESVLVDLNVYLSIYMDMHACIFFPSEHIP